MSTLRSRNVVSIPQGTINTLFRSARCYPKYCVSIPQGTINTKYEYLIDHEKFVSIPQGTINTSRFASLSTSFTCFHSARYN